MFARYTRSWTLTKQSFSLLSKNPVLMLFPCLSAIATLAVIASFLLPLFYNGTLTAIVQQHREPGPMALPMLFAFYYCCYFVQIFFNCALMASANMVLCGGKTSLRQGLELAGDRFGQIAVWALLAATVGWLLRSLQERTGLFGRIIIAILGMAWSAVTYFILPVVMFEGQNVSDGIGRSRQLVTKTWGKGLRMGISFIALNLLAMAMWFVTSIFIILLINPIAGLIWAIAYFALWMIVVAAADGIFRVVLYRYAWINAKSEFFDQQLMAGAFVRRKFIIF